jgi:hypothetical protein
MAWETSRDFTTGYVTDLLASGRWWAKITQDASGWWWAVDKQRNTATSRGAWWDHVAHGGPCGTRAEARRWCSMVLRLCVLSPARARPIARSAHRHGYFADGSRAAAFCPRCRERVEATVLPQEIIGGKLVRRQPLTQLDDVMVTHLIEACEYIPEREVRLLTHGREGQP